MGKVHNSGNWKIVVHPDYHPIPHFHVIRGTPPLTDEVSIAIEDLRILAPKGTRIPKWAKEALEWASIEQNKETLRREWIRITESNDGKII